MTLARSFMPSMLPSTSRHSPANHALARRACRRSHSATGNVATLFPGQPCPLSAASVECLLYRLNEGAGRPIPSKGAPAVMPLSECVLIVEDSPDGAESLRLLLETRGLRAAVAPDGPEGVRLGLELRPRAAVIDIGLPGFDGYEVCRRLRAALGKRALLVAHTAYAGEDGQRRAADAGFDRYLVKPTEPEELLRLLGAPGAVA